MNKPAFQRDDTKQKGKLKNEVFGWDVFNEDAIYNAYKTRCKNMPFYPEHYAKQKAAPEEDVVITEDKKNALVADIDRQLKKRKEFSRPRIFDFDEEVTYINEQNRVFNKKLQRDYKDYTREIKANLERGSALNN